MELLERKIEEIIHYEVYKLERPDLFRSPLVAFSAADDRRYYELKKIIGDWHLNPTELLPEAKSVISYCLYNGVKTLAFQAKPLGQPPEL